MILPDSLHLRRTAIAYVYQNALTPERSDNLAFYDEVTKSQQFPEMSQLPRELVLLRRTPPDGLAEIHVGTMDVQPVPGAPATPAAFRLLIAEVGSRTAFKFFCDAADTAYEAFAHIWAARAGRLQLVEASFIATVVVNDPAAAAGFMRDHVLSVTQPLANHLGRQFNNFGVKLSSGVIVEVGPSPTGAPIPSAQMDLNIESSVQDPTSLVLTLLLKWPLLQIRMSEMQLPREVRLHLGAREFLEMNTEPKIPNVYLDQAYNYLSGNVLDFLRSAGR